MAGELLLADTVWTILPLVPDRNLLQPYPGGCGTTPEAYVSKSDDVFWRQFGVVLILLTVFGFAMYFVANVIGGRAHAKMYSDPDAVAARIAPMGRSRIGDPAAQTQAPAPATSAAVAASTAQTEVSESGTAPAPDTTAASSAGQAPAGAIDVVAGEKVYQSACFACHMTGVAEAPKLDDPAVWEPRLGQGMAGLLRSVIDGKGAMPPKGGFAHLNEDELRNAIGFMLDQAGVSVGG